MEKTVNIENEDERREYLDGLSSLFRDWFNFKIPNLRDIIRPNKMDWLLTEDINQKEIRPGYDYENITFVDFVVNDGLYKDEPELDEAGEPLLRRATALLRIARGGRADKDVWIRQLFKIYDRFDANYVDDSGFSHFHVACQSGCDDVVTEFLELGQDPNLLVPITGESPLHLALANGRRMVVELLLRAGADPRLADAKGATALHVLCSRQHKDKNLPPIFFRIVDEKQLQLQIDARDNLDNTALHLAVDKAGEDVIMTLLGRDANTTLVNADGSTPLHIICNKSGCDCHKLAELIFSMSDFKHYPALVGTRDNLGNTPLHLILGSGRVQFETMEMLLRNGADPNLANAEGSTPLHLICKNRYDVRERMERLFEVCEEKKRPVLVDAKDAKGWTTLQWAVASLMPDVVDLLFDHGADVFGFVFPDESRFVERLKSRRSYGIELELASGVLIVVERLEKRGYELNRNDALMILKLFAKYELFSELALLDQCSRMVEFWSEHSKAIIIKKHLSLHYFIRLPFEEAAELLTLSDCFEFASSDRAGEFFTASYKDFFPYLGEIVCRGFCRRWALHFFMELTRHRLSIRCCEMIIDGSFTNRDLYNICLAAEGQSHKDSEKKEQPDEAECDKKRFKRARKAPSILLRI